MYAAASWNEDAMTEQAMTEQQYLRIANDTFRALLDLFDEVDVDDAEVEEKGDVIHIRFRDGDRAVINTQRPVQQIWMAGGGSAWHFSYQANTQKWMCDRQSGEELFATLARLAKAHANIEIGSSSTKS